jgi:hypothetical protein
MCALAANGSSSLSAPYRRFPHVKRLVTRLLTVNGTSALPPGVGARLPGPGAGGSGAAWDSGPVSRRLAHRAMSTRTQANSSPLLWAPAPPARRIKR